jgi:hypothetical protein
VGRQVVRQLLRQITPDRQVGRCGLLSVNRRWLQRQGNAEGRIVRGRDDTVTPAFRRLVDQACEIGDALGRHVTADRSDSLLAIRGVDPTGREMRYKQPAEQDQYDLADQGAGQQSRHALVTAQANM